jgi:hypothetical protein
MKLCLGAKSRLTRLLVVITFLGALPAFASQPTKISGAETSQSTFGSCAYGDLTATFTSTMHGTLFFDASGNPIRLISHTKFEFIITNPLNGKTATDTAVQNETFDLSKGTIAIRGVALKLRIPGDSTILANFDGRVVLDLTTGSVLFQTPSFTQPNPFPALCTALE